MSCVFPAVINSRLSLQLEEINIQNISENTLPGNVSSLFILTIMYFALSFYSQVHYV